MVAISAEVSIDILSRLLRRHHRGKVVGLSRDNSGALLLYVFSPCNVAFCVIGTRIGGGVLR